MVKVGIRLISGDSIQGYIDIPSNIDWFKFIDRYIQVTIYETEYKDSLHVVIRSSAIIAITEIFE